MSVIYEQVKEPMSRSWSHEQVRGLQAGQGADEQVAESISRSESR